jgi:hypothetical protein
VSGGSLLGGLRLGAWGRRIIVRLSNLIHRKDKGKSIY